MDWNAFINELRAIVVVPGNASATAKPEICDSLD